MLKPYPMSQNIELMSDIYSMMSERKILMTYLGEITPEITNNILRAIKEDAHHFDNELTIQNKVYNIIVECLENVYKHSSVLDKSMKSSLFLLGREENYYRIMTGNYVYNYQIDAITKIGDEINAMNRDEIIKKYSEIISKGESVESSSPGLGMIDMALKSNNKIEYEFKPAGEDISFYILKLKVNS